MPRIGPRRSTRTVVYIQCRILGSIIKCLIDTGANVNLIVVDLLKILNVTIDAPADRNIEGIGTATSLEWVKDIPVTFGRITIDADILVCDKSIMKNQNIILGFLWL